MTFNLDKRFDLIDFYAKNIEYVNYNNNSKTHLDSLPCGITNSSPSLKEYNNVVYTPCITVSHYKRYGCLYDEDGKRIEDSCEKEREICHTKDPVDFVDPGNLDFFEGKAIYLGTLHGHYGHFLIESISRWWPLVDQLDNFEYYLFHLDPTYSTMLENSWISEFLLLAKIDKKRIIYFNKTIKIKSVIVPEISFQLETHIFRKYREICKYLVKTLELENIQQTEQPIYFSRRLLTSGVRKIEGEELLEKLLLKNGFYVAHPQLLPISEQIYLINRHKYIVGLLGTALHNLVFSLSSKKVTYITSEKPSLNYLIIDTLCQNESTYINSFYDKKHQMTRIIDRAIKKLDLLNFVSTNSKKLFLDEFILNYDLVYRHLKDIGYVK